MRKTRYVFPAVFDYAPEGITVTFPDFPGCVTEADFESEAIKNAHDALASRLLADVADGRELPQPTMESDIELETYQSVVQVDVTLLHTQIRQRYIVLPEE